VISVGAMTLVGVATLCRLADHPRHSSQDRHTRMRKTACTYGSENAMYKTKLSRPNISGDRVGRGWVILTAALVGALSRLDAWEKEQAGKRENSNSKKYSPTRRDFSAAIPE